MKLAKIAGPVFYVPDDSTDDQLRASINQSINQSIYNAP